MGLRTAAGQLRRDLSGTWARPRRDRDDLHNYSRVMLRRGSASNDAAGSTAPIAAIIGERPCGSTPASGAGVGVTVVPAAWYVCWAAVAAAVAPVAPPVPD